MLTAKTRKILGLGFGVWSFVSGIVAIRKSEHLYL